MFSWWQMSIFRNTQLDQQELQTQKLMLPGYSLSKEHFPNFSSACVNYCSFCHIFIYVKEKTEAEGDFKKASKRIHGRKREKNLFFWLLHRIKAIFLFGSQGLRIPFLFFFSDSSIRFSRFSSSGILDYNSFYLSPLKPKRCCCCCCSDKNTEQPPYLILLTLAPLFQLFSPGAWMKNILERSPSRIFWVILRLHQIEFTKDLFMPWGWNKQI